MAKKVNPPKAYAARGWRSKSVVFVSHSSQDRGIASVMAEKIRAVGAEVWLDEKDLEGGDVLAEKILQGIRAASEAVILVSSYSVQSLWVVFEVGALRGQGKRVTPILNGGSLAAIDPLKDLRSIELNKFNDFLEQLGKRISGR